MAFDVSAFVMALTTAAATTTGQWWTSTQLVGTPTRGLPLTLLQRYAATSAALGTANFIVQASDDGTNNIRTVGQFLQLITDATSTAIGTGTGSEQTINVSSPRQGYLRGIVQLTGANPGHTWVGTLKIGTANPA